MPATKMTEREEQCRAAGRLYGLASVRFHRYPDQQLDLVGQLKLVTAIEQELDRTLAQVVLTHHAGDTNADHRMTHAAVRSATRAHRRPIPCLLCFEILESSLLPAPNWYETFGPDEWCTKSAALECYRGESRTFPHPRSTTALRELASLRGIEVGAKYAEAFTLLRSIQ